MLHCIHISESDYGGEGYVNGVGFGFGFYQAKWRAMLDRSRNASWVESSWVESSRVEVELRPRTHQAKSHTMPYHIKQWIMSHQTTSHRINLLCLGSEIDPFDCSEMEWNEMKWSGIEFTALTWSNQPPFNHPTTLHRVSISIQNPLTPTRHTMHHFITSCIRKCKNIIM